MFPVDKNLSSRKFGKISKCKDLGIEIERMCHLKPILTHVAMGALSAVMNIYNKSLESQV